MHGAEDRAEGGHEEPVRIPIGFDGWLSEEPRRAVRSKIGLRSGGGPA